MEGVRNLVKFHTIRKFITNVYAQLKMDKLACLLLITFSLWLANRAMIARLNKL